MTIRAERGALRLGTHTATISEGAIKAVVVNNPAATDAVIATSPPALIILITS